MVIYPDHILTKMNPKDRKSLGKAGMTKEECNNIQMIKSEKELQGYVAAFLRFEGIAFCHARFDRKSTMTVGWPDFTFAFNGIPIAFECKSESGKLSKEQEKCHENMRANGWRVYVITNMEQVKGVILKSNFKKLNLEGI